MFDCTITWSEDDKMWHVRRTASGQIWSAMPRKEQVELLIDWVDQMGWDRDDY